MKTFLSKLLGPVIFWYFKKRYGLTVMVKKENGETEEW